VPSEPKYDAPIGCLFRANSLDAGNPRRHGLQNVVEYRAMVFVQILCDERQVLTLGRKMFGKAGILDGSGRADVKVRYMPILDEAAESARRLKALKLAKALYCQYIRRLESLIFALFLLPIGPEVSFILDCISGAVREANKVIRFTATETGILQFFPYDIHNSVHRANFYKVCD
jgi:hypothetical protein